MDRFNLDQSILNWALVNLISRHGDEYGEYADVKTCMLKLIEKGADINGEENLQSWFPPLHTAVVGECRGGGKPIPLQLPKDLLRMDGIQLNSQSRYWLTALHTAVLAFNLGAVLALLKHEGVDLDIKNKYGHSAFDCALGNLKYDIHDDHLPNAIAIVKAFLATDRFVPENKQAMRDALDALIDFNDRKDTIDRIEELYHIPNTERLDASHSIDLYSCYQQDY